MTLYKKKFRGQKVSFRFLESHEVISENDLQVLSTDRVRILQLKNLNDFIESKSIGDKVLNHPDRTYIRILYNN